MGVPFPSRRSPCVLFHRPCAAKRFHWAVGALAGLALAPAAFAQAPAYPSKPITIVVGYPPGGSTDLMGRMVGTELSNRLGQPVVIENIGGRAVPLARRRWPAPSLMATRCWWARATSWPSTSW